MAGAVGLCVVGLVSCDFFKMTTFPDWATQPKHAVVYATNGASFGSPPIDSSMYRSGQSVRVMSNSGSLARSGFAFAGWNLKGDGTGTSYAPGQSFVMGDLDVTLYAQWVVAHKVIYSANGATGGSAPTDSNLYVPGATVTAAGPGSLVNVGYSFIGWNTLANGAGTQYTQGAAFAMGATDVTLYAQWTNLTTCTVTYSGNGATGGSAPTDGTHYLPGATVTVLDNTGGLSQGGLAFSGWNTLPGATGIPYAPGQTFAMGAANVTLYAVWVVATPAILPPGGRLGHLSKVSFSCATPGVSYAYTLDGSTPTESAGVVSIGTLYSGPFALPYGNTTVKVLAFKPGDSDSAVVSAAFMEPEFAYSANRGTGTVLLQSIDLVSGGLWNVSSYGTGTDGLAADPSGRFLYSGNAGNLTLGGFSIDPSTGALTPVPGQPFAIGTQPGSMVCEPSGRFLYVVDVSSDDLMGYAINPATGSLASVGGVFTDFGPTALVADPVAPFLFVAIQSSGSVEVFQFDSGNGSLTALGEYSTGGGSAVAVAVDPNGRYLYASSLTTATVTVFSINSSTGALTIVNTPTPAGAQPTSMAMDPTGHFLYVGDGLSGAVVAFGINQSTGALSSLGTFPAGLVTSLSIDPSGAYLYATNYSGSSISEFRINPASGLLTSIGVASGLANPALVVTTSAAQ